MTKEQIGFEPIETAAASQLKTLQLNRLRTTLSHAYAHVPHYRNAWDAADAHPEKVRCLEDLRQFPFTTKEDLRQNYPFGMFAVPMDKVVRIHASSGTTGKPTVVGYTKEDIDHWASLCARSIHAAGGRQNDKIHIAYGYGLFTGGLGAHYGAERLGATTIPMSGGQTPRQVQLIHDFEPDIIMCTPSYLLNIADEFQRQGLDPSNTSLRVGILGAEPWSDTMRQEIEHRCGLDAVDIYGLSEVMGPGVASECIETKDGPTIWEDHFYPEIIDPKTGEVLPDGEFGELVFTSLTKRAMPVIRYRTRDLTRLLAPTARSMRRMERIRGRSDDMLIIRGVNVFPSQVEERLLEHESLSPHYQLEVYREGQFDALAVKVELRTNVGQDTRASIASALVDDIKSYVGVRVRVDVLAPGGIPRSEGKAVRVIDTRH